MPKSRIPSPSRSQGAPITPRQDRLRRTRSVASPALSTASGRLTSVIEHFKEDNMESFALSPLNSRRSVLTDNTDIEEPRRRSWWKNLKENSRDINEVLENNKLVEDNQAIEELIDIEVLSQEKNNHALDLPESSGSESINSIVLPQRKLFTQKDIKAKPKFGQLINTRESLTKQKRNTTSHDNSLKAGTKELFQGNKRSKPIFPAALLNVTPNKTIADKTKELPAEPKQTRNIFGNRPANKRKNMFANFIVSDSEDEIPEIQPKVFGFQKKVNQVSGPEPQASVTCDIDMDDWKHLPSSTMVEHQLEEMMRGQTPVKRARLESHEKEQNKSQRSVSKRFPKIHEIIIDENMDESPKSVQQTLLQMLESADEDNSDEDTRINVNDHQQSINKGDADRTKTDNDIDNQGIVNYPKDNEEDVNASTRQEDEEDGPENYNENLVNQTDSNKNADKSQQNKSIILNVSQKKHKDKESENKENDNQENISKTVDENEEIENKTNESQLENEIIKSHVIEDELNESKDVADGEEIDSEHDDQVTTNLNEITQQEAEKEMSDIRNHSANTDENDDTEVNDEVENCGDVSQEVETDASVEENDENEGKDEEVGDEANNESQENEVTPNDSQEIDVGANESLENELIADSHVEDDREESDVESDQELEDKESDQEMEDSIDADKAIASDEAEPDAEQSEEMDVEEEETEELKYESDVEEIGEQNESTEAIEETPNKTHDTTGRHRKKELDKSPEVILHDTSNQVDSFTAQGNNTSIRKTMSKTLHVRPSMASPRESTGNSTGEGSGWDSHRTTRKTLRQTFGKDFTVRKSLRALVMEKSAKRQTEHLDIASETVKFPQANSTELPNESDRVVDDLVEETDPEVSIRTRRNILETHLQRIKQENMEERIKIRESIRNSIKPPTRDPLNIFIVPTKPAPRRLKPSQNTKKQMKTTTPFGSLPPELIEDLKYKPPKRFQPASWTTKRLYKFLETRLQPKYDYKARIRAEKLVETIHNFVKDIRRHKTAPVDATDMLKHEMARLDIVKTHFEFYEFFHEYMPREVRIKVVPDIVNMIPLPRHGVFAEIINSVQ